MNQKASQYFRNSINSLAPLVLCLALLFLTILPYQVPFLHMVTPSFALIGVYFFTVKQPELMPMGAAFLLGIIPDLWSGGPPGIQALMLILTRIFLIDQRRFIVGRSILVAWLAFGLVALLWGFFSWILASLYLGHALNLVPVIVQVLITIAIYPPMSSFFGWLEQLLLE
jgi:rod shape-determining protein MreD